MPWWAQAIVAIGAVIGAGTVIWRGVIRPAAEFITMTSDLKPLMEELLAAFREAPPNTFKVLADIASQFRTDSGTSLRDVIDRIEEASIRAAEASKMAAEEREEIVGIIRREFNDAFLTAMAVEKRAKKVKAKPARKGGR
jgi:hypothetical protein